MEVLNTFLNKRDDTLFDSGNISFIMVASAIVSFMTPGIAFLYAGLARRKSALSLIWVVSASNAVGILQWYFWGYSLSFSPTAINGFMGNLENFGLMNVLGGPSPGTPLIPDLLYAFYQMEFACVAVGILVGGIGERGRVLPAMVFTFVWLTLVYCPLACWAWNINGWAFKFGVLDFAGGGPVEIGSGMGGLAYAWVLGRRQDKESQNGRPYSVSLVNLGTFISWFGWLGFNGGSAFGANMRAVIAMFNTMLSAAAGGIVWCSLDYRLQHKFSMVGFCSGTISGLIVATPSSGFIQPWAAVIMGMITSAVCNFATKVKFRLGVDDSFDLFAQHAVGGSLGLLANAFFASHSVIALDKVNTNVPGGWVHHNWKQFYIQIAYVVAACSYTFIITFLIAHLINIIPGLHLRVTVEGEILGLDEVEIGEFANDYIEVSRDVMEINTIGMNQRELTLDTIAAADDDRHGPKSLEQKGQQSDTHIEDLDTDSMEKC